MATLPDRPLTNEECYARLREMERKEEERRRQRKAVDDAVAEARSATRQALLGELLTFIASERAPLECGNNSGFCYWAEFRKRVGLKLLDLAARS